MTTTPTETPAEGSTAPVPAGQTSTSTEVVALSRDELKAWLSGTELPEDATDEITYEIAMRILGARDAADLFRPDQVKHADDLIGVPFLVRSVTWRRSTKSDDGTGRYAVMECADKDGQTFMASCGGTQVVLQLRAAEQRGWLPYGVTVRAMQTAAGNTAYRLESVAGIS